MLLDGFGLTTYRSFGDEIQFVGPCAKVTLLAGQNNSGKSNILTFLHGYLAPLIEATQSQAKWSVPPIDRHIGAKGPFQFALGELIGGDRYKELLAAQPADRHRNIRAYLEKVLNSRTLTRGSPIAWFTYEAPTPGRPLALRQSLVEELLAEKVLDQNDWLVLWSTLTNRRGGSEQNWISETLPLISPLRYLTPHPPKVELVPAIRRVGDLGTKAEDYSGAGLIDRLAQLQNPGHFEQHQKSRFAQITEFLRRVLENDEATLEIPYERDAILVHMDGRTLPLSSLGTGIHEVVILAAAATVLQQQIVCIEEPELHLHPLLQRKLVNYLRAKTSNQYFITTHSAHFLETPEATVFHIRHHGGVSAVERITTPAGRASICADLGYRASDLVQANCVVWVEGPSDRVYLKHWLHAVAPDAIEGIHYSIMFYGGRLLAHLSANDPEVNEFISLRRLNRYIAILIDSDKRSARTRLNETKRRVSAEFEQGPGFAWITKGREIENYIPQPILDEVLQELYKDVRRLAFSGIYDPALHYFRTGSRSVVTTADKVKIARAVARRAAQIDHLDLGARLRQLVQFIEDANDL